MRRSRREHAENVTDEDAINRRVASFVRECPRMMVPRMTKRFDRRPAEPAARNRCAVIDRAYEIWRDRQGIAVMAVVTRAVDRA